MHNLNRGARNDITSHSGQRGYVRSQNAFPSHPHISNSLLLPPLLFLAPKGVWLTSTLLQIVRVKNVTYSFTKFRLLSGGALFPQKSWLPFRRRSKGTKWSSKSPPPSKNDSCSAGRCTWCAGGGALTNFACKLRLNFFSPSWGVQVHPLHPLTKPVVESSTKVASKIGTAAFSIKMWEKAQC